MIIPLAIVAAAAELTLVSSTAQFSGYCYEPSEPYCVREFGEFMDEYEFQDCRRAVERYQREVQDYLVCVENAAVDAVNEVIEKFNCRARGDSFC
ncbi:hypothetical protein L2D00_03880 [Hyphomonadaceae bacterium BL14]|nr:hypothetical protein L2D00_03880 [Hyphomonadaceae bacterium BL14]